MEVKTPNFRVLCDSSEKKAQQVAVQFETIRAVFRKALPLAAEHNTPSITVVAVKDEKALSELLPEFWLKKGQTHPAGVFYGGFDRNYIALRMDAGGDAYGTIYHEYYHSITVPFTQGLPLWVLEGTAEFFGHTQVSGKESKLGIPDPNLLAFLQQQRMPLSLLMQVDHSSPYYNEQNKTSIFYAESWALIHYLMLGNDPASHQQFQNFLQRIGNNETAEQANRETFGDLHDLENRLNAYMNRMTYSVFVMSTPEVETKDFSSRQVAEPEVDAILADSFVRRRRFEEAEPLLKKSLELTPDSAIAHENYGFLEFARGNYEQAEQRLKEAIALNSDDYLAYYYHARLVNQGLISGDAAIGQVQSNLERAIALNPNFAPSYSLLAMDEAREASKWPEAMKLSRQAIQMEPGNLALRMNFAQTLMRMDHPEDALRVLQTARPFARSAQQRSETDSFIASVQQYMQANSSRRSVPPTLPPTAATQEKLESAAPAPTPANTTNPSTESPASVSSTLKTAAGIIADETCSRFEMNLTLSDGPKSLKLHARNYIDVDYFTFTGSVPDNFNPCKELKGLSVHISYNPVSSGTGPDGEIQKIEIQAQQPHSPQ